ncbi:MAG: phosphoribosylaminoimidazolesuccinocarboxamide synthase [Candidatus Eisenbacteria bacterium]|nr:phosphoribosylaminoimidazolesuccinocarboxamide synthase [Candidatus Eisenbacteria bacterium]
MNEKDILTELSLIHASPWIKGKVREVYDLGERLLIVATDRISAYDCVLPTPIPGKGKILTQISIFWFEILSHVVRNHFITSSLDSLPGEMIEHKMLLEGRSMIVKKARRIDIECVVRGYVSGSAWREYLETGCIGGRKAKSGLKECEKLDEPLFTPTTKSTTGHDEPRSMEVLRRDFGAELVEELRRRSIKLYSEAHEIAMKKGIIVADTKFEFGMVGENLTLIDEALTPDSSRFWPLQGYCPGSPQRSLDKQIVRNYLDSIGWRREPPPPVLPREIVEKTRLGYEDMLTRLTGRKGI